MRFQFPRSGTGNGGDDRLFGGAGDDVLKSGPGIDICDGETEIGCE